MNYNKEIDKVLDEWEKASLSKGYKGFCRDGLMYKGGVWNVFSENEQKEFWGRRSGDEDALWCNSSKRIMFLMKDTNGNPNQDYREWLGRQNKSIITHKFFKNIALWLLGLNSMQNDGSYTSFKKAIIPENFSRAFDEIPFAFVNSKKESGGPKISDATLWNYCLTFGSYLKQQVDVLQPNIIICGGGTHSTVLRIAEKIIYPELDFKKINSWIYHNDIKDIVLINSYHPSARKSFEEIYNGMMSSYSEFVRNKSDIYT